MQPKLPATLELFRLLEHLEAIERTCRAPACDRVSLLLDPLFLRMA
jgi:hypothetical protein